MLSCKKCDCRGIGMLGNEIIVNICPEYKLKNSFISLPGFFRSTSIDDPCCFVVNNVKYLTVSGKGILKDGGKKTTGVFTLTLVDSNSLDEFSFAFSSVDSSGSIIAVFVSISGLDMKFHQCKKCSGYITKKKSNYIILPYHQQPKKKRSKCAKIIAKKIIFGKNGKVEEEDISNHIQLKKAW